MATISQKLLDDLANVIPDLAIHIAGDINIKDKLDAMYKIIVTGNGTLPLPEQVRIHSAWIIAHDSLVMDLQNKKDEVQKETRLFKKQIMSLFVGEALTLIGLIITIWFNLK